MKKHRIVIMFNLDYEGSNDDPENAAREDIRTVVDDVAAALHGAGYTVFQTGISTDVIAGIRAVLRHKPDAVFNLCESIHGDNRYEPLLPMFLDLNHIAYTGNDWLALSLCLHKEKAKNILVANGVPTPRAICMAGRIEPYKDLRFPLIVKPAREDASVGISMKSVVKNGPALEKQVQYIFKTYRQPALVEEFIEGREVYASVLCNAQGKPEILPLHEIDFSGLPEGIPRIVSFSGKWREKSIDYVGTTPVRCVNLPEKTEMAIKDAAIKGYTALGMRDYMRFDMRVTAKGVPYVIDVNPNCDLSRVAGGFSRAAYAAGMTYEQLVERILAHALRRARRRIVGRRDY